MKTKEPKVEVKKIKKVKKITVSDQKASLITYTLKAVIPVGPFANVQPEITVTATNIEEAEKFAIPHIDKLFVKYFNSYVNGVPVNEEKKNTSVTPEIKPITSQNIPVEIKQEPMKTEAYIKANQAIDGCTSSQAIQLILQKIDASTKLTQEEKVALLEKSKVKSNEYTASA